MAVTQNTYTGNGATVLYSFTFPYLETTDVKVTINGTPTTAYTFANATTIQFNTAPANGAAIRIYRDTDDASLAATFYSGSAIRAQDLNDNFTQNLYVTQEVNNNSVNIDGSNPMVGPLNMNGFQITNLPVPAVDTNAATKKYVDDRFGNLDVPGHTRWRKVATASQTIFSGTGDYGGVLAYSPTREQVYINGALQQRGVDYAADNGTSVVFTVGLTVGDVVDIICINNLTNSAISNAANINYSGQFSGQTARTVAAKLADVISVKDFGAVGDGVADDTAAIQAAINAAQVTNKALFVQAGSYRITATLNSSTTGQLLVIGEGKFCSTFRWDSPAPGVMWNVGVWGVDLREIGLNGRPTANSNFYRTGDTALKSLGDIHAAKTLITGFNTQIDWDGGYYHRFENCDFDKFGTCFLGGAFYNLHFSQCRWAQFKDGLIYSGGSGPITFYQCAIEQWTGVFINGTAGAKSSIAFDGCYFENYPETATTPPLASGTYGGAVVCGPCHNLTVTGCNINVKGIQRFLSGSGATIQNVTSTGNRINYSAGSTTTCEFIYYATNINSGVFVDNADPSFSEVTGTFTTSYLSSSFPSPNKISGYDAITNNTVGQQYATYLEGSWTPDFSGSGGSAGAFAGSVSGWYTKVGRRVTAHIRVLSLTNLGSWSGNVRISLPFVCVDYSGAAPASVVGSAKVRIHGANSSYVPLVNGGEQFMTLYWENGSNTLPTYELLDWSEMSTSSSGRIFATISYLTSV